MEKIYYILVPIFGQSVELIQLFKNKYNCYTLLHFVQEILLFPKVHYPGSQSL